MAPSCQHPGSMPSCAVIVFVFLSLTSNDRGHEAGIPDGVRAEAAERTLERIHDAATALFRTKPFADVTLQAIAKAPE
ncbi:hypothetical protein [Luteitalea sp.]|uniref:hypothetical protein n=1 Tax=Luteitalea sp. TaxID=2004800 RepID=UPI0037C875CE